MKRVLIISGHTDLKHSIANKTIIETLESHLEQVETARLDELYPHFDIDARAEQERLLRADIIILQFPLFWYSAPSILQRWMEQTFLHGFSHGSSGDKLKGKKLILSITSGAPADIYRKDGAAKCDMETLMHSFKATCQLTQMEYCGLILTGGVSYANRHTPELIDAQKEVCKDHAAQLIQKLNELDALR